MDLDIRDRPADARRGVRLTAAGELSPAMWDVDSTYGAAEGAAEAFVTAAMSGAPTLALRVHGRKLWGAFPFFDAAFVGGASTLPGYHSQRFAGDAGVDAGAQLRVTLGRSFLALPASGASSGAPPPAGCMWTGSRSAGGTAAGAGDCGSRSSTAAMRSRSALRARPRGTLLQSGFAFGF